MCIRPSIRARANRSGHRFRVYRSFRLHPCKRHRTIAAGRRRRQPHQTGQIRANRHHPPKTDRIGLRLRAFEQLARYFTRPKNEPLQGAVGGQGLAWPPASGTIHRPPPIPHQAPAPRATVWHDRRAVGPLLDDCHRYHTQPRPLWSFFCLTRTAGGRGGYGSLFRNSPCWLSWELPCWLPEFVFRLTADRQPRPCLPGLSW